MKGVDPLRPGTRAWDERQARHVHNGHTGRIAMARQHMYTILRSRTVSDLAKSEADQALRHLDNLTSLIKERLPLP